MFRKLILVGVIIMVCIGLFGACSSGIWFKVGYAGEGGFGSKETDEGETFGVLTLVGSLQEMKDLCDEWNNPAYQEESELYSSEISKKIREYDEAFFEEKALIIRSSFDASPGRSQRISSLNVEGTQLIVNVRYSSKKGTFNDIATTWLFLIEVKKADIVGVTAVQINEK